MAMAYIELLSLEKNVEPLLFHLLSRVPDSVVVVVEDGSGHYVHPVPLHGVPLHQSPLEEAPNL